ncbi:hypothetical protein GPS59_16555 [Acinetobacter haemolyticus]|uniref:hypothetical protein n=1 Tax=Acinetobacter TaxID=469 RepID=UPI00137237B9|nr:hypothetical protein [Acinetobacter haemolyticus]NAR55528.1 hypothetical protein [Acinetobacter haemolyticus]
MEFPKNIAEQLADDSVGATRAWRHQMICKLIDAGITNPGEIKHSVDSLYDLVISQPIPKTPKPFCLDAETLQVRMEGILHGKNFLDRLRNFVYLLEDEMRLTNQKEKHLAQESHNHQE